MPPISVSADTCISSSVSVPISSEEIKADHVVLDRTEELEPQIDKNNPEFPIINFSPKLLEKLREPWKDCLIIKLIDKSLSKEALYSRTKALWDIHGEYTLIPLNSWYFIVKFDRPEDYNKVINGLPWIIMKHYLSVRKWEPNFACDAKENVSMTWIKLPDIKMELYNEEVLFRFAQPFGKPIKIDRRCARICVQIDLLKPVMTKYSFVDHLYKAEYDEYILKSAFLGEAEYDEFILNSAAKTYKYFKWEFPPVGFKKLNTDGSYLVGVDKASFGGLFRNEKGEWLRGYYGNIGSKSVNYVELWSIYQGLLIAEAWSWKNILVETDSKEVVRLILEEKEIHRHPLENVIELCRTILLNLQGEIKHIFREKNYCADKMASLGGKQNQEMMEFENPPAAELELLLLADVEGKWYARSY